MPDATQAANVIQEYFINVFRYKYVQVQGRARREEYWMFVFSNMICIAILSVLGQALPLARVLVGLYPLVVLLPSICLGIRRLHDIGKSGWWLLLIFIPLGNLVLLVFFCLDSQPGENQYGPNPKGACSAVFPHKE